MESFDGYGGTNSHMTKWNTAPSLATSSPTPRTGAYCARSGNRAINPGSATVILGCAIYWPSGQAITITLYYDVSTSGSNAQDTLELGSDGKIRLRLGASSGAVIDTSVSAPLVANSWNAIEWKILVSNSGTYTVKVNGVQVLNGSADTQNQAATSAVALIDFVLGSFGGMDDVYMLDSTGSANNDFIGDCKVECLTVQTGNGSNVGLTPSTGTDHGALVDELPANDDTDYNFSATVGAKDTYAFTNVATVGSIKAVQVSARAKKTDVATKELALVTRMGTTDYDGATQTLSTSYAQFQQIWAKRPSDNADWTISDVNAAEFGVKVVT
jgi:hypothetical protein